MRMKSIVEFMSEGCLSCRGNSINLWNEMEKWIELTNRQRVNEWAAVNGNEQAPPTQAPNARGKLKWNQSFHSLNLWLKSWWNWRGWLGCLFFWWVKGAERHWLRRKKTNTAQQPTQTQLNWNEIDLLFVNQWNGEKSCVGLPPS